jgi:hypothetical protein
VASHPVKLRARVDGHLGDEQDPAADRDGAS